LEEWNRPKGVSRRVERRGGGVCGKGEKVTVYPNPPWYIYSKNQISGVSGPRAGVSG